MNQVKKYFPLFLSLIFLVIHYIPQLINPVFPGDSGLRLNNAQRVVLNVGNRIWLPFLQFHIFIFYLLNLPFFVYKLIPLAYFIILLIIITRFFFKLFNQSPAKLFFLFLLLFCFVNNKVLLYLGVNLYQEIIVFALFYLAFFIYFFDLKPRWLFFLIVILGLITREDFWIYYIIWVLMSLKKEKPSKVIFYLTFGIVPVIWLFYTGQPMLLKSNSNPTLDLNKLVINFKRLIEILSTNGILPIYLCLLIVQLVIKIVNNNKKFNIKKFISYNYFLYSYISLFLIYTYIVFYNPWEATPYNFRIIVPAVIPIPMLVILVYYDSLFLPKKLKSMIFVILLTVLLFLTNSLDSLKHFSVKQHPFYSQINTLTQKYNKIDSRQLRVAFIGLDYWGDYIPYFIGPLLYQKRIFISKNEEKQVDLNDFNIIITPDSYFVDSPKFFYFQKIIIPNNHRFLVLFKK